MKKLSHKKIKNTGILFELLTRQITADTLNGQESKALPIVKEFFGKNTELRKELTLYQSLLKEKYNSEIKGDRFLEAVLKSRATLSNVVLNRQKHNLIKSIKENFVIEEFFSARIPNYKTTASIYKIFENSETVNPVDYTNSRLTILEHISTPSVKKQRIKESLIKEELAKHQKPSRLLIQKLLVDKFNQKYTILGESQKSLLKEYINNGSVTSNFKEYVDMEVFKLKKSLKDLIPNVDEPVTRIKLREVTKLIDKIPNNRVINESHILSLMRYYDLVDELKKLEDV